MYMYMYMYMYVHLPLGIRTISSPFSFSPPPPPIQPVAQPHHPLLPSAFSCSSCTRRYCFAWRGTRQAGEGGKEVGVGVGGWGEEMESGYGGLFEILIWFDLVRG